VAHGDHRPGLGADQRLRDVGLLEERVVAAPRLLGEAEAEAVEDE
jgi:hypothetical protein